MILQLMTTKSKTRQWIVIILLLSQSIPAALTSAAVVPNADSRCRRFFSLNNKQHEANLPPLSLYIYNSARLLTFSCAHLEDRANRNNTVPCQKNWISHNGECSGLLCINLFLFKFRKRDNIQLFSGGKISCQGCEPGINSSPLLDIEAKKGPLSATYSC